MRSAAISRTSGAMVSALLKSGMTKLSAGWPEADIGVGCRGETCAGSPPWPTQCQAARSGKIRPAWAIRLRRRPASRAGARQRARGQPAPDQSARGPELPSAAMLRESRPVLRSGSRPRPGAWPEPLQRPAAVQPVRTEPGLAPAPLENSRDHAPPLPPTRRP